MTNTTSLKLNIFTEDQSKAGLYLFTLTAAYARGNFSAVMYFEVEVINPCKNAYLFPIKDRSFFYRIKSPALLVDIPDFISSNGNCGSLTYQVTYQDG